MKTLYLCLLMSYLFVGLSGSFAQPIIDTQPQDQEVVQGDSAIFSVGVSGLEPITYQWRRYLNFITCTNIAGATNSTFAITNAQPTIHRFAVVVSNSEGAVTSRLASLTVTVPQPPVINRQPLNQIRQVGGMAVFSVLTGGDPPLYHQWRFQGEALTGETNTSLRLNDLEPHQGGSYDVVVTNFAGSITSQVATLSLSVLVNPPYAPGLTIDKEGDQLQLALVGEGILESAPAPTGPWTEMGPIVASSTLAVSSNSTYYRVRNPNPKSVEVFLPRNYDETQSWPLVIALHGYPLNGLSIENFFHFRATAQSRGILYCYPNGIPTGANYFWTGTDACCNFAGTQIDDTGFLQSLILEIIRVLGADPKRIFLAGHSNGGFMVYKMACEHSDLIAGVMSLAGATYASPADCQPSERVHILQVHGTADGRVSYNGGSIIQSYPSAVETFQIWGNYNGATGVDTEESPSLDLDNNIDGMETIVSRYSQFLEGGAVELWTMQGSTHFPDLTDQFSTGVIEWFLNHPKP